MAIDICQVNVNDVLDVLSKIDISCADGGHHWIAGEQLKLKENALPPLIQFMNYFTYFEINIHRRASLKL